MGDVLTGLSIDDPEGVLAREIVGLQSTAERMMFIQDRLRIDAPEVLQIRTVIERMPILGADD